MAVQFSLRDVGLEALYSGIVSKAVSLENHTSEEKTLMHLTLQLSIPSEGESADSSSNSVLQQREATIDVTDPPSPFVEVQNIPPLTNSHSMPVLRKDGLDRRELYDEKVEAIKAALVRLSHTKASKESDPDDIASSQLQLSTSSTDSLHLLDEPSEFLESDPESQQSPPTATTQLSPGRSDDVGRGNGFANLLHVDERVAYLLDLTDRVCIGIAV